MSRQNQDRNSNPTRHRVEVSSHAPKPKAALLSASGAHGLTVKPAKTAWGPGQEIGLGLSVVHALVPKSGGGILVESQAGLGSAVNVYLPAVWRLGALASCWQAAGKRRQVIS